MIRADMANVRGRKGLPGVRVDDPVGQRHTRHLCGLADWLAFPLHVLGPVFEGAYPVMGALGTALVGFNVLALVVILDPLQEA